MRDRHMKEATFLTAEEVAQRYGINRATVYRWVAMGTIPKPVRVGGRTSRFLREELDAHDARQAAERGAAK